MNLMCFTFTPEHAVVCLFQQGRPIWVGQESLTEKNTFPLDAVNSALSAANLIINDISYIAFAGRPFLNFYRELFWHKESFPWSWKSFVRDISAWPNHKLILPLELKLHLGYSGRVLFLPYHLCLLKGAQCQEKVLAERSYLIFSDAQEEALASFGQGRGNQAALTAQITTPISLSAVIQQHLGLRPEQLSTLAQSGRPIYLEAIKKKIKFSSDGGLFLSARSWQKKCPPHELPDQACSWLAVIKELLGSWVQMAQELGQGREVTVVGEWPKLLKGAWAANNVQLLDMAESHLAALGAGKFVSDKLLFLAQEEESFDGKNPPILEELHPGPA